MMNDNKDVNKITRQMSDFAFEIIKEVESKPKVGEEKRKFYEDKSRKFKEAFDLSAARKLVEVTEKGMNSRNETSK